MRVLLLGASGFLGRAMAEALIAQGHSVRAVVRREGKLARAAETVSGDLRDVAALATAAIGCDAICHLAGLRVEWPAKRNTFDLVDVQGMHNVIRAARENGIRRILYVSLPGASRANPNPLLSARWRAEEILRNSPADYTIWRPSLLLGENRLPLSILLRIGPLVILPDVRRREAVKWPLSLRELVQVLLWSLEARRTYRRTIDIGGPVERTIGEILEEAPRDEGILRLATDSLLMRGVLRLFPLLGGPDFLPYLGYLQQDILPQEGQDVELPQKSGDYRQGQAGY